MYWSNGSIAIVLLAQLISFALFATFFINVKSNIAVKNIRQQYDQMNYRSTPVIDRLVFIVIDALREDFVFSPSSPMIFTKKLLDEGKARGFVAKASAPTVTLPRLKALTAGTPPMFLDFLSNLDEASNSSSSPLSSYASSSGRDQSDSWIKQLHLAGKKMVFLGDDTWLRLFPKNYFLRTDPTTSFYVKDTVIVDRNVTRNIDSEFSKNDWDVLIMHYLGVDHIGHNEGPHSPLMGPKLIEMDEVVRKIYEYVHADEARKTAIFVLGDHGMTDSGNHGGSSPEETNTACVVIRNYGTNSRTPINVINQLDIAPTISSLFDVPIPLMNIGKIISSLLDGVSKRDYINLVMRNLIQVSQLAHQERIEAEVNCLKFSEDPAHCQKMIENKIGQLVDKLAGDLGTYDVPKMLGSMIASAASLLYLSYSIKMDRQMALSVLCYCLSVFSSSFIEEEHEIWNHFVPLLIMSNFEMPIVQRLLALAAARILRIWNANGYEYRNIPDMRHFLEDKRVLQFLLLSFSMLYFAVKRCKKRSVIFGRLACAGLILLYKVDVGKSAQLAKLVLTFSSILGLLDPSSLHLLLLGLNRNHNSIAFVLIDLVDAGINGNRNLIPLMHYAYFSLGKSNLIASIDLSNSYIGLADYNPIWVALMTLVISFSGPLHVLLGHYKSISAFSMARWRAAVQLTVMTCCFLQRYHISVWTVFTPRLLFECLWTIFYILAVGIGCLVRKDLRSYSIKN